MSEQGLFLLEETMNRRRRAIGCLGQRCNTTGQVNCRAIPITASSTTTKSLSFMERRPVILFRSGRRYAICCVV